MSLAVAIKNTAAVRSCIQVSNEPNIRRDNPPSALALPADAKAFSISSIHNTTGHHLGLAKGFAQLAFGLANV